MKSAYFTEFHAERVIRLPMQQFTPTQVKLASMRYNNGSDRR
jgi:hypothetical protein